jgi:hypothetical protein
MTAKHTPGPWSDEHLSQHERSTIIGGRLRLIKTDGVIVAFLPQWLDTPEETSEARANARLIAAAPDLLAVCQELEESVEYWSEYDVPLGIADRIRAAIAKATGGES